MVPVDFIQECKEKVALNLDDQRIGPELRVQDFDEYMRLINEEVNYD